MDNLEICWGARSGLIGGSIHGGSAALDQQLIIRPIPGMGRVSTPIRGLYLASSSAPPGGSVHGYECGTGCVGTRATHTAPSRLRAAFGE
jgi:phytoene dehydrogenase-like protein